jgi:hypothetical protein
MKILFLDDERNIEDVSWVQYPRYDSLFYVRTYNDFCKYVKDHIKTNNDLLNHLFSFDHDIADFSHDREKDGYDCLKFLVDYILTINLNVFCLNHIVHSKNCIGKANINCYVESVKAYHYEEQGYWDKEHLDIVYYLDSSNKQKDACTYLHKNVLFQPMHSGDLEFITYLFNTIDIHKLSSFSLITLLRTTSCYKKEVSKWAEVLKYTDSLLKSEGIDSEKELYGMI